MLKGCLKKIERKTSIINVSFSGLPKHCVSLGLGGRQESEGLPSCKARPDAHLRATKKDIPRNIRTEIRIYWEYYIWIDAQYIQHILE